jgi:two-component system, OmpR family, sensor histidine kinase RstB
MTRLVLRFGLGMLVVLVATFFIMSWGAKRAFHHHFKEVVPDMMGQLERSRLRLETLDHKPQIEAELRALRGRLKQPVALLKTADAAVPEEVRARMRAGQLFAVSIEHRRHGGVSIFGALGRGDRVLVLGPLKKKREGAFPVVLVLSTVIAVLVLTSLVLTVPLVRRVRSLGRAAQRISEGELEARATVCSKDAIGDLARRFNVMADRVQALLENQRELLQAVSHELRTPTARIRFGLEMLASAKEDEDRQKRIDAIDEDLVELDQLVEELLLYIRSGDNGRELQLQPLAAKQTLRDLADRVSGLRPEIAFDLTACEDLKVIADEKLFRRAMQNLLTNALRHAEGTVALQVEQASVESVRISVCDDGAGVPPEQRDRIFEPFIRTDDSRSRDEGGNGLGLAIVKKILTHHKGTVTVTDADLGGACFVTTWGTYPRNQ